MHPIRILTQLHPSRRPLINKNKHTLRKQTFPGYQFGDLESLINQLFTDEI